MKSEPELAIVIVTRNRQESLFRTLNHLVRLEEPFPIVVVDNASQDHTVEAVQDCFPDVKLIALEENHGAVARNYGVSLVKQPYVAFSDDDSWWAPSSLSQAVELFDQYASLGLIMSKILVGPEQRYDPCCQSMEESPLPDDAHLPGVPILGFIACGALVRRSAFLSVNGFCQKFGSGGEEALLAIDLARNAWGLTYLPEIVSHHHPSKNRDSSSVKVQGVRNALWTAWLRRSPQIALWVTRKFFGQAIKDREVLAGVLLALYGAPWVARHRDPVPPHLERLLRLVEANRGSC